MTRAELVARLREAGLDFLTADQANRFINEAAAEYTSEELWPWRTQTATGTAPLVVTDLGPIDYVRVPARRVTLYPQRKSRMLEQFGSLDAASGFANYYFVEDISGTSGTVVIVPQSAEDIELSHFSRRFWTIGGRAAASDNDAPLGPVEHHELVEMLARERALRWNHEIEEADQLRGYYGVRLEEVKDKELKILGGWDEPDVTVESADW